MSDDEDEETLRRKLYRLGATDADRTAYRLGQQQHQPRPIEPPQPNQVRRRLLLGGSALALTTGTAVLVGHLPATKRQRQPDSVQATADPVSVIVSSPERDEFIARLTDGRSAGLTSWLAEHGGLVPGGIGIATRSRTVERAGAGRMRIQIANDERRRTDLRISIVLVLNLSGQIAWTLTGPRGPVTTQAGLLDAGVPYVGATVFQSANRPTDLRIDTAASIRWGIAAVFST